MMKKFIKSISLLLTAVIMLTFGFGSPAFLVYADSTVTTAQSAVTIHYYRFDGNYSNWNVYAWDPNAQSGQDSIANQTGYQFTTTDSFGEVTKIPVTNQTKIGIIVRRSVEGNAWADKDVSTDRFVENINGGKDIWLMQGDSNVYESEPEKLQSMHSFIDGKNYIDVKLKQPITVDGTANNGFTVSKYTYASGKWETVSLSSVQNAVIPVDDGKTPEERGYQVINNNQIKFTLKPGNFGLTDDSGNLNVYVSGDMNAWGGTSGGPFTPKSDWKMTWDAVNKEYTLTMPVGSGNDTVAFGNGFKFTAYDGSNPTWYPGGMGNNIILQNVGGTVSNTTDYLKLNLGENADITAIYKVQYAGYLDSYTMTRDELSKDKNYIYSGSGLGESYAKECTAFKLWAPTAVSVNVLVFDNPSKTAPSDTKNKYKMYRYKNGTWAAKVKGDLDGKYYLYDITVPVNGTYKEYNVADPYSKGTSANSERSLIYNPKEVNSKVPGWSTDKYVSLKNNTDAVLYEAHVRDISMDKSSGVNSSYNGKYMALTQTGAKTPGGNTSGLDYLKELGITHIHLLPTFDYGSVDENNATGSYNWGYDPVLYDNVEGSYSTDPNGTNRQVEYKKMVESLHSDNIGLVTDVVFNHTLATGENDKSIFDKVVPGYYYRIDDNGNYSNASGCGNEFASDKPMARKFILDSIKYWMKEYHVDGLRFDLMAAIDKETMLEVKAAAKKINPNAIIYGEGWDASSSLLDPTQQMDKVNAKGTGVAVFNDEIREDVKGDNNATVKGFAQGGGFRNGRDRFDSEIKGASSFVATPNESINYVSCHDNYDLWDDISKNSPEVSDTVKKKMCNLANAIILTSQGIPFVQEGSEFCRTKAGGDEGNSYNSIVGNDINWNLRDSNSDMVNYYEGLIALRKAHPAFRMTDSQMVNNDLTFAPSVPLKTEEYVISNNANGDSWKNILVVYNGSDTDETINVGGSWNVAVKGSTVSLASPIETTENKLVVPAYSTLIAYSNGDYTYPVTTVTSSVYSVDTSNFNISGAALTANVTVGEFLNGIAKGSTTQQLNVFAKDADVTNSVYAKNAADKLAVGDRLVVSDFGAIKTYNLQLTSLNPNITMDGQIDNYYGAALGQGGGSSWGAVINSVYAASDMDCVYLAVYMSPKNSGNNLFLMLDDTNMNKGVTDLTGDAWVGYGDLGLTNNAGANIDYEVTFWRNDQGVLNMGNERSIKDYSAGYSDGCTDHQTKTIEVAQKTDYADGSAVYEFKIPYSSIGTGAKAGDVIKPYILFGKDKSNGGIRSVFPIQTDTAVSPLTVLDKAPTGFTLK